MNNVDIIDPTYSGIMFQTDYVGTRSVVPGEGGTIFTNITDHRCP